MPRRRASLPDQIPASPRLDSTIRSTPSRSGSPGAGLRDLVSLLLCVGVAGAVSVWRGQDANWDLQNYHYYNPWAWWNGRIFDRDIVAAQLQTFHNALFDLPFYAMVQMDWPPRVIAFVLAVPAGIAAFFLAKLLPLLFADLPIATRRIAVTVAFALGVTSAMSIATLGTTMNEWPLVALLLPALWLLVRAIVARPAGMLALTTLFGAGVLVGLAAGGKLTAATFAVGICAALLVRNILEPRGLRRGVVEAFLFGLGVLAGLAVTFGPWGYTLWTHFESPVFPYFNQWIQSPWWINEPVLIRVVRTPRTRRMAALPIPHVGWGILRDRGALPGWPLPARVGAGHSRRCRVALASRRPIRVAHRRLGRQRRVALPDGVLRGLVPPMDRAAFDLPVHPRAGRADRGGHRDVVATTCTPRLFCRYRHRGGDRDHRDHTPCRLVSREVRRAVVRRHGSAR